MKISHLQENLTPASAPSAPVPGPKFGRSDEMLESDTGSSASTTTAGAITTRTGEQRKGKKSIFQGIKNAGGFANSRKAGIVGEGAINEDDLSEEQLQAKKKREDLFNRAKDRDIGNKPKSREIMARESDTDDNPKPGSWQEIAKLNNITDPRKLQADKSITLPNGDSYYVNKGDTLSGIAQRLRTTVYPQYGELGSSTEKTSTGDSSTLTKPAMYVGGVNKRMATPVVQPDPRDLEKGNSRGTRPDVALPRYPDSVYDYKPEVSTSSSNTIHPPGTSITAKIKDPKAPNWPLDVNLTKGDDGKWRNEKGQLHNFNKPGDKEQLEKMPALPPNQSSAETKRLNSIPKNKEPDIHSQAAQDAQWEKDKENMGNAWDEFKGWVKKPRSFTIVPGKDKPPVDPAHDIGQRAGLSPDEIVKRLKSAPGGKDDTPPAKPQKSTTSKASSASPNLSPDHKVIAGIESGNKDYKDDGTPVVSPKGAQFAMQVMKDTNRDPGFGVVPAKNNSPEESNRVGRDYFDAMMKKYNGDKEKASAAYNAGPGRVDSKIAKAEKTGKDWKDLLPRETRNYIKKFNKGTQVASSNDDTMNEDISQKYARDYEYILTYLLSEVKQLPSRPFDLPPLEGGSKITELLEFDVSSAAKRAGKKLVPGFGFVDAGIRAKDGDYTGAAIGTLAGIAGLIPGGQGVSLGADAVNQLRDYAQEKGGWGNLAKEVGQSMSDYYGQQGNLIPEDLEILDEQGFLRWLEEQDLHNLSETGGLRGLVWDAVKAGAGKLKNLVKPAEREVDNLKRLDQRVEPGFSHSPPEVKPVKVKPAKPDPRPNKKQNDKPLDPKNDPLNYNSKGEYFPPGGVKTPTAPVAKPQPQGPAPQTAGGLSPEDSAALQALRRKNAPQGWENVVDFGKNAIGTATKLGTAGGLGALLYNYGPEIKKKWDDGVDAVGSAYNERFPAPPNQDEIQQQVDAMTKTPPVEIKKPDNEVTNGKDTAPPKIEKSDDTTNGKDSASPDTDTPDADEVARQVKAMTDKTNESTVSRMVDEYEQILESLMGKLSLSEERTETKNEKGEVTSWRDESDWRKVKQVKGGRGRVTNLSDKARRETETLTQKKEVTEGWKDIYNLNKQKIGNNPNLIKTGTILKMPDGSPYKVKSGDNLSSIAKTLRVKPTQPLAPPVAAAPVAANAAAKPPPEEDDLELAKSLELYQKNRAAAKYEKFSRSNDAEQSRRDMEAATINAFQNVELPPDLTRDEMQQQMLTTPNFGGRNAPGAKEVPGPNGEKFQFDTGAEAIDFKNKMQQLRQQDRDRGHFDMPAAVPISEEPTDYQKRRQRERDVDAGKPVKPEPKNPQTSAKKKGMGGQVLFFGTGDNGGKYEIIQSGDDFMIYANGKHIDSYGSLQRAMSVLKNEVPGLTKGVAEDGAINVPPGQQATTQPDGSTRISKLGSVSRADYAKNMAAYKVQNQTPEKIADFKQRMASGQGYTDTERQANLQQQQQHFGKYADTGDLDEQSVAEGSLNEFAIPGGGDGDSGRWYNDDELADIIGDDWFEDFDVSNDGFNIDAYGEKAKKNLVGYANTWFDDKGYNVNVMGVEHNDVDHDLQWYIVGSFHNPRFANEGMAGKVVFSGTGDNGGKYEIIQSGDDFMIHANGKHIDSYGSLQRAMSVLQNEVPGLTKTVAEEKPGLWANIAAKRKRIAAGSGEHMRKPGSKGAPTADALRKSAK